LTRLGQASEALPRGGTVLEWPQTRRLRLSGSARPLPLFEDIVDGVRREDAFEPHLRALVEEILRASRKRSEPAATMGALAELAKLVSNSGVSDPVDNLGEAVLALACVEAFRQEPTSEAWEYLWSLAWHSGALEQFLPQAMVAASTDPTFKGQFLDVARDVVENAIRNPGRRAIAREQGQARQLREDWNKNPNLTALWQRNFERGSFSLCNDDDGVLRIVADIDTGAFIRLLGLFDSPHPIAAALDAAGARWSFSRWAVLLSAAPVAFDDERRWNGSPIVPLLLSLGRDQLRFGISTNASEADLKGAADEIAGLTDEIAKVIARRPDAAPVAERWAAWLMRWAMAGVSKEPLPYPADARSGGYVDMALINALAQEISPTDWSSQPSTNAEPWEPWCYRAVVTCVSLARNIPLPSTDDFLREWALSPEDWCSERGQNLKAHASFFETSDRRADAYGTRLLAVALVENANPERVWLKLWNSTSVLREIVEFGDADGELNEDWRGRSEASGLMRLAFGLGLMMMDHLITPSRKLSCDRKSALEGLLSSLTETVREMAAIDQINNGYWGEATRHLAIRRAVWLAKNGAEPSPTEDAVFGEETTPTFADYIRRLAGDVEGLFAMVEVALRTERVNDYETAGLII
jgi:hypothetical protein